MSVELKPCPFCGGEAKHMSWGGGGLVANVPHSEVFCTECRMTTGPVQKHGNDDRAVERWNTRPTTDAELEVVAYRGKYKADDDSKWEYYETPDTGFDPEKYEQQALNNHAQSSSIIADKDALISICDQSVKDAKQSRDDWKETATSLKYQLDAANARIAEKEEEACRWHKKAMDAGVITHTDGTTSHPMRKERDDLKAQVEKLREDANLLDTLLNEHWDLRCFDIPTGGDDADVGWRVVGHWMAKPTERTIAEVYHDDPRAAIRATLTDGKK